MAPDLAGSGSSAGRRYLEHLTGADLALLAQCGGEPGGPDRLPANPQRVEELVASPAAFDAVFGPEGDTEALARVSPFLVFALAVHRATLDLHGSVAVEEWIGPRRRLPVLGAGQLAEFLDDAWRRLFLAELLASYTHAASGTMWVPTRRGMRRRRVSELDPVQLAGLIDVVPEAERAGVYRRLGDLALFLTGVFPDSSTTRQFAPLAEGRLLRAGGVAAEEVPTFDGILGLGRVGLLEYLGERWYRLACASAGSPATAGLRAVADVADRFSQARRTLNLLADRYLFPLANYWSDGPAA